MFDKMHGANRFLASGVEATRPLREKPRAAEHATAVLDRLGAEQPGRCQDEAQAARTRREPSTGG